MTTLAVLIFWCSWMTSLLLTSFAAEHKSTTAPASLSSSLSTFTQDDVPQPASLQLRPRIVSLNIMVAGLSGLGKTTTCHTLFESWNCHETSTSKLKTQPRFTSTTVINASLQLERHDPEANTILRIKIIDTPGFGNQVNHRNSVHRIARYIEQCRHQKYASEMSCVQRNMEDDDDSLVHVCLYFISPGRFLEIDKYFLQSIQNQVTVVPIIAKADTLTDSEISSYRTELQEIFEKERIHVYEFDHLNNATSFRGGRRPERRQVLAIVSRDGIYPWGKSRRFDPSHSDLQLIQELIFSKHTERFVEAAMAHYTIYRARRIRRRRMGDLAKYTAIVGLAAVHIISDSSSSHTNGRLLVNQSKILIGVLSRLASRILHSGEQRNTETNENHVEKNGIEADTFMDSQQMQVNSRGGKPSQNFLDTILSRGKT